MEIDPAFRSLRSLKPFMLAAVAGILTMWDITPVGGQGRGWDGRVAPQRNWEGFTLPVGRRTAGVDHPAQDLRVHIKRRSAP